MGAILVSLFVIEALYTALESLITTGIKQMQLLSLHITEKKEMTPYLTLQRLI